MINPVDKSAEWTIKTETRLVQFVRATLNLSSGKAKTLIERGHFAINGQTTKKPGAILSTEATLTYRAAGLPSGGPFGVRKIHIDPFLVVVDKPSGLLSAPLEGSKDPNALGAARRFCQHGGRGPKVIHRLDKSTSGVLAFGRGLDATRNLANQLETRTMTRTYRAVVHGTPKFESGIIVSHLISDTGQGRRGSAPRSFRIHLPDRAIAPEEGKGKWSGTRYKVVWSRDGVSGLELSLLTGRTHQIRIHLAEMGTPVCGEQVYARSTHKKRLALHAAELVLMHPKDDQEMRFDSPWPESLRTFWRW